jgi:hypothetical protein
MDDFEQIWEEEESSAAVVTIKQSDEYQIRDGLAKYRIFSNFAQIYFSEKHGEKIISETFKKVDIVDLEFHL